MEAVQAELTVHDPQLGRAQEACIGVRDRVDDRINLTPPGVETTHEKRQGRGGFEDLAGKALQGAGRIGHAVEDLIAHPSRAIQPADQVAIRRRDFEMP